MLIIRECKLFHTAIYHVYDNVLYIILTTGNLYRYNVHFISTPSLFTRSIMYEHVCNISLFYTVAKTPMSLSREDLLNHVINKFKWVQSCKHHLLQCLCSDNGP